MACTSKRPAIDLTEEQKHELEIISRSRTAPAREVERPAIILRYAARESIVSIQKNLSVNRPTIYKCIDKAIAAGPERGLKDMPHSPKKPEITEEPKAWVVNLACTKPKEFGYAAEVWSQSQLAEHTIKFARSAGHSCLCRASKATILRILKAETLHPHKIKYFLERGDPDFERKMQDIFLLYQDVNFQNVTETASSAAPEIVTVSVDEKPGVQAIKNIAKDLGPMASKHSSIEPLAK